MFNPYFSIIVPVYKTEQYLDQCIQSVLNQDMHDYELILVDDGSPDNCPKLCDDYSSSYSFIRTIHQGNGGLSAARNAGLSSANGKYIIFIDSDDFWCCNDALSAIKVKLEKIDADVLIFGMKKYYQSIDKYSAVNVPKCAENEISPAESIKYIMENNIFVTAAWDKVIKRSFIEKNNLTFVIGQLSEDVEWCAKILIGNPKITILSKCIYVYRQQNSNSITSNISRKNIECISDIIIKYASNSNDPAVLNYIAEQYILWLTISNYVNKKEISDLLEEMKKRYNLINYDWYPRVKQVKHIKILGFNIVRYMLGLYKKIIRKRLGV